MKQVFVDGHDTIVEFPDDTPDSEIQEVLASNFSETDDQFVNRIADPSTPASDVSFEDYQRFKELKPDLSWSKLGGLVIQGAGLVAKELFTGVRSTAKLAAEGKLNTLAASGLEGSARGVHDLANLGTRIHDNLFGMLEPYMKETGDAEKDAYNRFLGIKEMDNLRESARRGDSTVLQRFGIGVDPSMVNPQIAEGASYFLDPSTLASFGTGKIGSILAKAAAKPAQLASKAAGAGSRAISAIESKASSLVKKGSEIASEATGGVSKLVVPGVAGAAAASAGIIPTGIGAGVALTAKPALDLAEGLFQGFAYSMSNTPTRIGPMLHLAQTQPATIAGKMAGRLKFLDPVTEYAGRAAAGGVTGAGVGGGLGFLAGGAEGLAQGLGTGGVLGGATGTASRFTEGLTGSNKLRAEQNDYTRFRDAQDNQTKAFLDNNLKSHKERIQVMDAIQLAQVGAGDQANIRILPRSEFKKRFPDSDGVQILEGDAPVAYINGRSGDARVLMHEVYHTMARLDRFDGLVAGISNEIGKMYSPDEIVSLIREYESRGIKLRESEGITTGDKLAALTEEIGAETFANYIKGKDSSYLLKGSPFKDALKGIMNKFVAGKLDRIYGTFRSDIFQSPIKKSAVLDQAMNDLIKARRKAYRNVELSADDAVRAYDDRDLGNDEVYKELQSLGVAETDNRGRRVLKSNYRLNKEGKALGQEIANALKGVDDTGGIIKQGNGSIIGRSLNQAQADALANVPGLSDKVKEVINFISKLRQSGSDAANITYAAATYKTKRGKTQYRNLPVSNRDSLVYNLKISSVGTMTASILDLSLLRSKITRKWTQDARLQRAFGTEDNLYQEVINYINALGGEQPTATVVGGQQKRNLLNKLIGIRSVSGNPEIPDNLKLKDADVPFRSFRLDRVVKMRPLDVKAKFSEQSHDKGKINFSPSKKLNNRGGQTWTSPSGHRAIQTSSRAGVRVYNKKGTQVGPVFKSLPEAQKWLEEN